MLLPSRSFNSMDFTIRRAEQEDCLEMLELVRELAVFERAPDEVTVSLQHFKESGFGPRPVWWAFVACAAKHQASEAEMAVAEAPPNVLQDPLSATLIPTLHAAIEEAVQATVQQPAGNLLTEPGIQLEEPVALTIPKTLQEALPQQLQEAMPYEKVIGFALYYIRYSTWKGQRMYLEDIIVTESWRGKGVGTALMDALVGEAKVEGLHGISWQVLEWNEPAIKFYERYNARFDAEWINATVDV